MIAANELRIGNWILSDRTIPFQVYEETFFDIEQGWLTPKPISITDNILVKAGFVDSVNGSFKIWYDNQAGYGINYRDTFLGGIDYLHELQNIYFAITKEELSITL